MANRLSLTMERTGQWVFSEEIPTDVVVVVGEASFSLHKFMLVAKSNHIRKLILDSKEPNLEKINLSGLPGGAGIFEKAAKFCYGVSFDMTVHDVAALRCAADHLQMTGDNNLCGRTEDFLSKVALTTLSGALVVLKSCEDLLPLAEDLRIVQRCVEIASAKAHPSLDEIEREKACGSMDPLKLSHKARAHASQNKRLPLQIVLHVLYYDRLELRNGECHDPNHKVTRRESRADVRTELMEMKMYIKDTEKARGSCSKRPSFFSAMSRTLGKLNPFGHGSKDTLNVEEGVDTTVPRRRRRRRFSIS